VILSWFGGGGYSSVIPILDAITGPLLEPIRRILPNMGGLDFSPVVLIILIRLSQILLVGPILDIGSRLAV
jgi:YggT family protein